MGRNGDSLVGLKATLKSIDRRLAAWLHRSHPAYSRAQIMRAMKAGAELLAERIAVAEAIRERMGGTS